jgi:hypothetical protein
MKRDCKLQFLLRSLAAILAFYLSLQPASGAEPKLLPQKLLDEGWISLFDGQTLYGWQPVGEAKWEVSDGEIRTQGDRPGFLMTTTRWANYVLHVEFKADAATNSGIFLRTPLKPTDPARDCFELNIAPADNPYPTGSLVAREKASMSPENFPTAGEWHSFDVYVEKAALWVQLNGKVVLQFLDDKPSGIGHIGLQSREGPVAFRNVRLKPHLLRPLLNGHDLENWSFDRKEKCSFDLTEEGELHLTSGTGQLETKGDFANFVLQLECKVNGDGLNSGIFFRTLRTGRWVGYESQIHNGFKNGDPTQPADFGTGGIYRRQPARRVVADDRLWFHKTIVADGPHMAVWVNGYQVTDWTDPRDPHENPREGKRLGPGVIAIQGHDPTTDFSFRNIRAAELPQ